MRNLVLLTLLLPFVPALAQTTTLTTTQAINQVPSQTTATTPLTPEQQQQAAAAQAQALQQGMQGATTAQQQAFAQDWATKHRTAFVATAIKNSDGVNSAYAFRNNMSGDAQCQRYAQQADDTYLSSTLDQEAKQEKLAQLGKQANAANCMQ